MLSALSSTVESDTLIAKESEPDDLDLIRRATMDAESVALLYRRYNERISRYIRRRVGNRATAEDLTADVFLSMVKYLPRYKVTDVPFYAWLYRLATNRINRWARWQSRKAYQSFKEIACTRNREAAFDNVDHVQTALLTIPVRFQTVITLHYLEEMNIQEIAQIVGCRPGTVKSRLSRGRDLLRVRLQLERNHDK